MSIIEFLLTLCCNIGAKKALGAYGESDELDNLVIDHPGEIIDAEEDEYLPVRETSMGAEYWSSDDNSDVESLRERENSREKSKVRQWSEGAVDRMEL